MGYCSPEILKFSKKIGGFLDYIKLLYMKTLQVLTTRSIRELARLVNDLNAQEGDDKITKEDIVQVVKGDSQYFLLYFGE
jgi:hypothetical protein